MKTTISTFLLLLTAATFGQLATPAVKGKIYLYIDETIHLYLNGAEIFSNEGHDKAAQTKEIELKPGDRIVARISNESGPHGFQLLFASSDFKKAIRFTHTRFRILPDPTATDFTPEQFGTALMAKEDRTREKERSRLPFKTKTEWVWGETEECTLGAMITAEMFQQLSR